MKYSPSIQKLIDIFSKFPTVGPKTAARFVFYLLGISNDQTDEMIYLISQLKKKVKVCQSCFNSFEPEGSEPVCKICSDKLRDQKTLCLVEKEADLVSIEETKKYKGLYFVLGGTISGLRKKDIEKIRGKELEQRIKNSPEMKEIIIATNANSEGEATALFIERLLKPFNKKTTRLARGLPLGGELEYADSETLASAIKDRKPTS